MSRVWVVVGLLCAACLPTGGQTIPAAAKCAGITNIALLDAKVTLARLTPIGSDTLPKAKELGSLYHTLPPFCRVMVTTRPSADSDIKIEIWLPTSTWNGKYRGQGNGGFAGAIDYRGMAAAVREGYATAGTDTGHTDSGHMGLDASFALGHPERVKDFGWRAIHEMTIDAKAIAAAYYGERPAHSYFASCSDGGREALMEAQRFPGDYDGILAGSPANDWTHLLAASMWDVHGMFQTADSYIPATMVPAIASAVIAACDAQDGVRDGVLNDPRTCRFTPETMLCKQGDADNCLLPAQVQTLKKLYAGPHDSADKQIFPGYLPGGEDGPGGWVPWITGPAPRESLFYFFSVGYFANFIYDNPRWDGHSYNVDTAVQLADKKTALALNATDTNLKPFFSRGGKLIMYHGWNDPAIPAMSTIDYYNGVVGALGKKDVDSSLRLYMVPGMQHCEGGPGATAFGQDSANAREDAQHDVFTALEKWVENGTPPERLIAKKFVEGDPAKGIKMTRPLCPYPLAAKYNGNGNTNDAVNFICSAEAK